MRIGSPIANIKGEVDRPHVTRLPPSSASRAHRWSGRRDGRTSSHDKPLGIVNEQQQPQPQQLTQQLQQQVRDDILERVADTTDNVNMTPEESCLTGSPMVRITDGRKQWET